MANFAVATALEPRRLGWKASQNFIKKAMEQEFSWSGLVISLSIAFFIVSSSSLALNFAYVSISAAGKYIDRFDPDRLEQKLLPDKSLYLASLA